MKEDNILNWLLCFRSPWFRRAGESGAFTRTFTGSIASLHTPQQTETTSDVRKNADENHGSSKHKHWRYAKFGYGPLHYHVPNDLASVAAWLPTLCHYNNRFFVITYWITLDTVFFRSWSRGFAENRSSGRCNAFDIHANAKQRRLLTYKYLWMFVPLDIQEPKGVRCSV